ncbi:hypothetical protein BGZ72_003728 [Mortierella alpina]|nr:hypothetical protein BGZ72_003728 [Mortierella alpina]
MRLKYGLYDDDVDEDAVEGGAGTQAGEQDVAPALGWGSRSGSGSGSGSRPLISAQSDRSAAGSNFWVGKQGFQRSAQDQPPRRDVHTRQRQQQQQGGQAGDAEQRAYQTEDLENGVNPAGDYRLEQFSDEDDNAQPADANEIWTVQTLSRSSAVNDSAMRPSVPKNSAVGGEVAAESASQEISPEARMLMALEAALENAMLDHEGKDGTEHATFSEASQFDDELDLSTEVVLRELSHEHDQPLTTPDELELRSWMYEEGQIGRPQRPTQARPAQSIAQARALFPNSHAA